MNDGPSRTGPGPQDLPTGDGVVLAHRDRGTGEPLVLLHGGFLDSAMWEAQIEAFARSHRVIAPDLRGHGGSAHHTRPFRHTDDVAALLRRLDCGPAVLVGLSLGGGVAVDTALEHPALVRAVVVSGVGTSELDLRDPWTTGVLADVQRLMAAGDAAAGIERFLDFAAGPYRVLADVAPEVVDALRAMAWHTLTTHMTGEPVRATPVTRTWERLPGVTVPVLAVNGGLDSEDHLRMAGRLAAEVANSRTATVEGTAHYPNMERPDVFDAILAEFLDGLPDPE
ncbi:alpha/beta fold hydrolase [Streptomyces sp. NPDC058953]|uniref:alpha/beta fold hydrolase n=1 Tax=unclassified Streptomyces TaxID=2593676 RepID=UPI003699A702